MHTAILRATLVDLRDLEPRNVDPRAVHPCDAVPDRPSWLPAILPNRKPFHA